MKSRKELCHPWSSFNNRWHFVWSYLNCIVTWVERKMKNEYFIKYKEAIKCPLLMTLLWSTSFVQFKTINLILNIRIEYKFLINFLIIFRLNNSLYYGCCLLWLCWATQLYLSLCLSTKVVNHEWISSYAIWQ